MLAVFLPFDHGFVTFYRGPPNAAPSEIALRAPSTDLALKGSFVFVPVEDTHCAYSDSFLLSSSPVFESRPVLLLVEGHFL